MTRGRLSSDGRGSRSYDRNRLGFGRLIKVSSINRIGFPGFETGELLDHSLNQVAGHESVSGGIIRGVFLGARVVDRKTGLLADRINSLQFRGNIRDPSVMKKFAILSFFLVSWTTHAHAQTIPESPHWLTYRGKPGPGQGKQVVMISAEQEYRSEQSMPMLAKLLAERHGFDCTVLFGTNEQGQVDPTLPVYPKKGEEEKFKQHHIPGLEHLEKADLVIFFTRLLTLPAEQQEQIVSYIDSGKPIIGLRTANHGFRSPLPYKIAGRQVRFGEDVLGGTFRGHHGNWHQDSTRGDPLESMQGHPILIGVQDIWGPSDVYRTFKEGGQLPTGCTALVYGQPLIGRERGGKSNPDKEPLPIVWIKDWKTSGGKTARVFHSTMASGKDFESAGLRRLVVNAAYWCLQLEDKISADSSVEYIGDYQPLASGFDYEKLGVIPQKPQQYK